MSEVPADRHYSDEHLWVMVVETSLRLGITDHAQDELGDITYVELPAVGGTITAGEPFGEVESTKTSSELIAPVSGRVTAVNGYLEHDTTPLNTDPYGTGWLVVVDAADGDAFADLLPADVYHRMTDSAR